MGDAGAGIICTKRSSPTIENCIFRDCTVSTGSGGGAIACTNNSNPIIINCVFSRNKSGFGGAIVSQDSSPRIQNCTFKNNTSSSNGGAIYIYKGNVVILECGLSDNEAGKQTTDDDDVTANGGAILATNCNLIIERCDIFNNTIAENSTGSGGGLSIDDCAAKIVDANIAFNQAYEGGGIYCTNHARVIVERCLINKNSASLSEKTWRRNEGGGIYSDHTELIIKDCIISDNQAYGTNKNTTGYGGGIFIYSGSGSFMNCLFTGNLAWTDNADTKIGCGGGLYAQQNNVDIKSCTFAHNTARPEGQGGGFYSTGSSTILNSIFWGNTGSASDSQIYNPSANVSYSDIQGGWSGEDNINANPCFASDPMREYCLSQTSAGQILQSPCVDKGSDTAENLGMNFFTTCTNGAYDIGIVDMGYHYVDTANAPFLGILPGRLDFEWNDKENSASQTITITNLGKGPLNWTVTTDIDWVSIDTTSGTCANYNDAETITVDVNLAGLDVNTYSGIIEISDMYAINNPQKINVQINAVGPLIELSQYAFYVNATQASDNLTDQFLSISNIGNGELHWQISDPCDWLIVEPDSGSTTDEIDDVNIIINTSGLTTGTYTCELTVTAEDAKNSPQTAEVLLDLVGPVIQLSQDYFSFETQQDGKNPPSQKLMIQNAGGGVLNWNVKEQCKWLNIEPESGSTAGDVNVAVDISGLESGIYTCQCEVYSDDDTIVPRTVTIQLVFTNYNTMDLDKNLIVNFSDFAILAPLLSRTTEASLYETSINDMNDSINFKILYFFCQNWLEFESLNLNIPDLVSHWKLDGETKDSQRSNHGVKYGGKWTEGQINQGLGFQNVDDRVVVQDDGSLTPVKEFTIAFWIYNRNNGGGGVYKAADCNDDLTMTDDLSSYSLQVQPVSSMAEFIVFKSSDPYIRIQSLNPISTDSWHHIVATFDGSEARLYVDGARNSSFTTTATSIQNDSRPLIFGCRWEQCDKDKYSLNIDYILDDIRIYSRALTGNEVITLYTWER